MQPSPNYFGLFFNSWPRHKVETSCSNGLRCLSVRLWSHANISETKRDMETQILIRASEFATSFGCFRVGTLPNETEMSL